MINVFRAVIATKQFDLSDMLKKIDTQWIGGKLTDAERTELIASAQGNANAGNSIDLLAKLAEQDKRLLAVEKAIVELKALLNGSAEEEPDTETTTYPDFETGKWYYAGDKITFEGVNYTCIAPDGVVCVWSPEDYPAYWEIEY